MDFYMTEFDSLVDQAAKAKGQQKKMKSLSAAQKTLSSVVPKKKLGRPTRYTEKLGEQIITAVSSGKTLTGICRELDVDPYRVYEWMRMHQSFGEAYRLAQSDMAKSLVDEMLDNARGMTPELALVEKVKAQIYQWTAARLAPAQFSDSRRLEISGQVDHRHTHELSEEQKQRIAESWLMSRSQSPMIEATTTGPDLPALEHAGVQEICETEQGVHPKRSRTAAPTRPAKQGKRTVSRSKPTKPSVDDPLA
jgi:hypothetical protein